MFEETTAASHALTAEADALAQAVARFRLNNDNTRTASPIIELRHPEKRITATVPKTPQSNLAHDLMEEPSNDGWEEF